MFKFLLAFLFVFPVFASKSKITFYDELYWAIDNSDIELKVNNGSLRPRVQPQKRSLYKEDNGVITARDGSYFLRNVGKGPIDAYDGRLNVVKKLSDKSYKLSTYNLKNGFIERAMSCQRSKMREHLDDSWYLGEKEQKYECYYFSPGTCRRVKNKLKEYKTSVGQCKKLTKELPDIIGLTHNPKGGRASYRQAYKKEYSRLQKFVREQVDRFDGELVSFIDEENIKPKLGNALMLFNDLQAIVDLCSQLKKADSRGSNKSRSSRSQSQN